MSGTGGFQTQAYNQPAAAVAGNRASLNQNLYSALAGPGGFVAGAGGVTVGAFVWQYPPDDPNGGRQIVLPYGSGSPVGFIENEQQGLNTTFLSFAGMTIPQGFMVTPMTSGDFWVVNNGSTMAQLGMKAYANFSNGLVTFAATGSPTTVASATGSTIAASTFSATGSIANDVMTITAVGAGTIVAGATISGTGITTGNKVVSQISGTAGSTGTYLVSIDEQTVASTTISGTYGTLTIGTLTTVPVFAVGQVLNATGSVVAGTTITQLLTGAGGSGSTFVVDNNTAVGTPQVISSVGNIETKWYARTTALAGEILIMSSTTLAGAVAA